MLKIQILQTKPLNFAVRISNYVEHDNKYFPPPLWGRRKVGGRALLVHPHPDPPPSEGEGFNL